MLHCGGRWWATGVDLQSAGVSPGFAGASSVDRAWAQRNAELKSLPDERRTGRVRLNTAVPVVHRTAKAQHPPHWARDAQPGVESVAMVRILSVCSAYFCRPADAAFGRICEARGRSVRERA